MINENPKKFGTIYETSLRLFEVFVQAIKDDSVSGPSESSLELKSIFDFILIQNFSNTNENIDTIVKVCIDVLTIVFMHIIVVIEKDTTQDPASFLLPPRKQNYLLCKLMNLDLFNIMVSLVSINNLYIRQHAFKILQLLMFVSRDFKEEFLRKKGFEILQLKLSESNLTSTFSLTQTLLNCIMSIYDNPNDLRPSTNTLLVQQVMNKSLIAKEIVNQTKTALNKPKKCLFVYNDFFGIFFQQVSLLDND
jgi:hypothetical protein